MTLETAEEILKIKGSTRRVHCPSGGSSYPVLQPRHCKIVTSTVFVFVLVFVFVCVFVISRWVKMSSLAFLSSVTVKLLHPPSDQDHSRDV